MDIALFVLTLIHFRFTSVEFYMAHSDYTDLIPFTESLLCGLSDSLAIAASYRFSGQFDKIDVVDCLEAELSSALGATVSLTGLLTDDVSARDELQRLARHCGLDVSSVASSSALLGTMISSLVEPRCHRPTFLMNHPTLISPLAKSHPTRPELAERFELFVNGQELCNSYSELADPNEQRLRFKQQMALRTAGDSEARPPDEEFCVALEYGMPPTAGWGLGIDRLVKLMTGAVHIRDVLLFPALRPKSHSVS
uniref:Aminoacyl-transfer RNA synthetases class-II family profile domain-containing protein n=2 Tax=Spongospora subterranea TaxID=70186 RepID=A0A0H5QXG0_9EUKA|eukprot:CRZ06683.1 hypothetical protein [Spongospora subterranea]